MMRLTGQRIFDTTQILAAIINEKRPMPGKGAYRVTKMHKALFAEFTTLNDARSAKIATYDYKRPVLNGVVMEATEENLQNPNAFMTAAVPEAEMPAFVEWWRDLASVETDVNIEPIPIDQLCVNGEASSITFAEFAVLADLVAD